MQTAEANPSTKKDAWVLCDDSTKQYGRRLGPDLYEFKEKRHQGKVQGTINLADYDDERREWYASTYFESLAALIAESENEEDWKWILAECIFEMTSY